MRWGTQATRADTAKRAGPGGEVGGEAAGWARVPLSTWLRMVAEAPKSGMGISLGEKVVRVATTTSIGLHAMEGDCCWLTRWAEGVSPVVPFSFLIFNTKLLGLKN